jgi:hypothetical protein
MHVALEIPVLLYIQDILILLYIASIMNLILDDNCSGAYDQGRLVAKQLVPEFNLSVVICTSFKSLTTPSITVLPISIY